MTQYVAFFSLLFQFKYIMSFCIKNIKLCMCTYSVTEYKERKKERFFLIFFFLNCQNVRKTRPSTLSQTQGMLILPFLLYCLHPCSHLSHLFMFQDYCSKAQVEEARELQKQMMTQYTATEAGSTSGLDSTSELDGTSGLDGMSGLDGTSGFDGTSSLDTS